MSKAEVVDALKAAEDGAHASCSAAVGAAVTETLCARVQEFTLDEAERRRREGRLDFHDLLVLTRDVLRDDAAVRRRLHERFQALLVDEFQDTDPLQVEIACLVAGDCGDDAADRAGRTSTSRRAGCSSSATPSSRSTGSAAPTSACSPQVGAPAPPATPGST